MRVFHNHNLPGRRPVGNLVRRTVPAVPVHRLTVVCLGTALNALRKRIFLELSDARLRVSHVVVSRSDGSDTAAATVTLACPPAALAALSAIVKGLSDDPDVRRVHWARADKGA